MELWIGPSKPTISGYDHPKRRTERGRSYYVIYDDSGKAVSAFDFEAGGTERRRSFQVEITWDDLAEIAELLAQGRDRRASAMLPLLRDPERFGQLAQELEKAQEELDKLRIERDRAEAQLEQVRQIVLPEASA